MSDAIFSNEPYVRLAVFAVVLGTMALWEIAGPRRQPSIDRLARWPNNLGILILDAALVRILFPLGAVGIAMLAESRGWGVLNLWPVPAGIAIPAAIVLLDLAIYLQHVLFHAVPWLWRLHRMHHADLAFDVTTGVRFHPIEILLSMAIKLGVVAGLGAPAIAVLAFEVILNATSMFNHANVRILPGLDRLLRWLVVTPDMHRVHHSVLLPETNSNFGFNLPWWDRLFGTYRDQPADGHAEMTVGVAEFRDPQDLRLDRLLTHPFRDGNRR